MRPNRTTQPLDAGTNIPELDQFQRIVEEPNDEVIAAREEKERRQREKGPAVKRKGVSEQKSEPKRKKKTQVGVDVVSISADKTVDVDPLNVAAPQKEPGAGEGPSVVEPNKEGGEKLVDEGTHVSFVDLETQAGTRTGEPSRIPLEGTRDSHSFLSVTFSFKFYVVYFLSLISILNLW